LGNHIPKNNLFCFFSVKSYQENAKEQFLERPDYCYYLILEYHEVIIFSIEESAASMEESLPFTVILQR